MPALSISRARGTTGGRASGELRGARPGEPIPAFDPADNPRAEEIDRHDTASAAADRGAGSCDQGDAGSPRVLRPGPARSTNGV